MPTYLGNTVCWPRGYCAMIFLIMALGLHLASVLTPVVQQKTYGNMTNSLVTSEYTRRIDVHLIKTWQKMEFDNEDFPDTKDKGDTKDFISGNCKKLDDFVQVVRSMFFCALGFCVLAIVAGIINACAKIPSMVTSILILFALACGIVGWAVSFAMWHKHYCTDGIAWKNVQGSKIGPAAPCLTAAWVLELLALICTCACEKGVHDLCGGGGGDREANSTKYDNGDSNTRGAANDTDDQKKQQQRNYVDNVWYAGDEAKVEAPPKPGSVAHVNDTINNEVEQAQTLPGQVADEAREGVKSNYQSQSLKESMQESGEDDDDDAGSLEASGDAPKKRRKRKAKTLKGAVSKIK